MTKSHHIKHKEPTQRQLRVGEELRHALSTVLFRNDVGEPSLDGLSITVSEVRISPDLRHATAYVAPLGGADGERMLEVLGRFAGQIRRAVTSRVNLRYSPQIRFKLDESFDYAMKISELMNKPSVARDIHPASESVEEHH